MSTRLARIAKVLHDDVGPALCGVGLQLDLLLGHQGRDIQASLETVIDNVRRLSYLAQDNVAQHFGIAKALELLPDHAHPSFPGAVVVEGVPQDPVLVDMAADEISRLSLIAGISEIHISFSPAGFTAERRP